MTQYPIPNAAARRELIGEQKASENFEQQAIIAHINATNYANQLYVLSMNRRMLEAMNSRFGQHANLALVDTPGFIMALNENGLLQEIGVHADTSQSILLTAIYNEINRVRITPSTIPTDIVDSSPTDPDARPWYKNDRPFAAAMKTLASELAASADDPAKEPDQPPELERPHYPNSGVQVARFRAREARRAELLRKQQHLERD